MIRYLTIVLILGMFTVAHATPSIFQTRDAETPVEDPATKTEACPLEKQKCWNDAYDLHLADRYPPVDLSKLKPHLGSDDENGDEDDCPDGK